MGLSPDQLSFLESSLDVIHQVMVGIMPALAIGSTLVTVWVCLLAARQVCQRRGLPVPDYGTLDHWKAPEMLVWGVIASGVLLLLPGLGVKTLGYVLLLGGRAELLFFGELLLIGVLMGELIARRWPPEAMAAAVCGAVVGTGVAGLWVVGRFSGKGLVGRNSIRLAHPLERTSVFISQKMAMGELRGNCRIEQ